MNDLITPANISFGILALSVIFNVFLFFRKPQEDLDKRQAISEKEEENRAGLLAQQVQWEKEVNEKKFNEFAVRLDGAFTLAQNHVHTVDTKVDKLTDVVGTLKTEITTLATIISERIPKRE